MGKYHGHIALTDVEEHEKQEERHTGDDVRIEHRDVVQECDHLLAATSHVMESDGCNGAERCRYDCSDEGDKEGVLDGSHERTCALHVACEKVAVEFGRESGPVTEHLALGEREHGDEYDRRIQENKQQPYVALCKKSLHD